jgi:hypothetical protein
MNNYNKNLAHITHQMLKNAFVKNVEPLDTPNTRYGVEHLPDYSQNPPYKDPRLKTGVRDHLDGFEMFSMAAVVLAYQGELTPLRVFYNMLEEFLKSQDENLTIEKYIDQGNSLENLYTMLRDQELNLNNGKSKNNKFWSGGWGVFTAYMDIVKKHNLIKKWAKEAVFGGLFE